MNRKEQQLLCQSEEFQVVGVMYDAYENVGRLNLSESAGEGWEVTSQRSTNYGGYIKSMLWHEDPGRVAWLRLAIDLQGSLTELMAGCGDQIIQMPEC